MAEVMDTLKLFAKMTGSIDQDVNALLKTRALAEVDTTILAREKNGD